MTNIIGVLFTLQTWALLIVGFVTLVEITSVKKEMYLLEVLFVLPRIIT